jgi:hypothetical protein
MSPFYMLRHSFGQATKVKEWNGLEGQGGLEPHFSCAAENNFQQECVVCGTDYNPEIEREQEAPQDSQVVAASPTISPREGRATRDVSAPPTALNKGADFGELQETVRVCLLS